MGGLEHQADLRARLGKHKTGTGCLYIEELEDQGTNEYGQVLGGQVEKEVELSSPRKAAILIGVYRSIR